MLNKRILVLMFVVAFLFVGCLPTVTPPIIPPTPKGIIGGRIMAPGPETTKDITGWIPVANATVTITDSEGVTHTVTTDEDGYYTFTDIAVDANTIITATGTVDGNTVIVKDVIPQAVAADGNYEAGIADAESTALALIVEELLKQGVDLGDIDLEEIQASDNFTEVVEQVNSILEENGNVTTDPGLTNTVDNVAEDIINPPEPTPPPVNHAPIITSIPNLTATVGLTYVYDVNATDPDGDTLTYSLTAYPSGMTIISTSGLIMWTPNTAQVGNNLVTVMVSDGTLIDIQSFTIVVSKPTPIPINHAPVIYSTPITTATVGVTYIYDVNATDQDGDALTYSLTAYPSGMTISSASGLIMWIPTAEGNYAVIVKVSDGVLSDTQPFTIVVNKPSVPPETYTITSSAGTGGSISPLGDVTVNKGANIVFTITPNTNYNIADVLVDGGSVGAVASYTFTNVAKDHTIYATFSTVEPEPEIELTKIEVFPDTMTLSEGDSQVFIVTAHYSDGTSEEVTLYCTYQLSDEKVAKVVDDNKVNALGVGIATISINYKEGDTTKETTLNVIVEGTITIKWFEAAIRFNPDGSVFNDWEDDDNGPATLILTDGEYHFADVGEFYNTELPDIEGSVVIDGTGLLSGNTTYTFPVVDGFPTINDFAGKVEIIIDEITFESEVYDGTMVGICTQWKYVFGTEAEVLEGAGIPNSSGYANAVPAPEQGSGWWFTSRTEYIFHGPPPLDG